MIEMVVKFLRENRIAALLLTFVRLYLGWTWMTAGWGKVKGDFDASGYLMGAIARASGENPVVKSWWAAFLEGFALPNVELFNFLVAWGEFLVGIGLLLGCFTTFSALMGAVMNMAFLLSRTISSNPEMLLMGILLMVAGANAGRFGLDHYVLPLLRGLTNKKWRLADGERKAA